MSATGTAVRLPLKGMPTAALMANCDSYPGSFWVNVCQVWPRIILYNGLVVPMGNPLSRCYRHFFSIGSGFLEHSVLKSKTKE